MMAAEIRISLFYSHLSLALAWSIVCHCMFEGQSQPPRFNGITCIGKAGRWVYDFDAKDGVNLSACGTPIAFVAGICVLSFSKMLVVKKEASH
jgi:hypothetical protein